jgi:hypothetical protein
VYSGAGAHIVPVGGDKQDHATGQQQSAQNERNHALPAQTGGMLQLQFKGADAACGLRIQDTGLLPAV